LKFYLIQIYHFILLFPSKILFKFKCYTSIKIESTDQIDDFSLVDQLNQQEGLGTQRAKHNRYSLGLPALHPKYRRQLRALST
jgi:hypothetical protein